MLQRSVDYLPPAHRSYDLRGFAQESPRAADSEILSGIVRSLRRNLKLITACVLIGTVVAGVAAFTITPQYKASVSIFVDPRRTQILKEMDVVGAPGAGTDTSLVESEATMMKSPALMRRVAEQLNLMNDSEFTNSSLVGQIKRIILFPLRLLSSPSSSTGERDPLTGLAGALSRRIEAKRRNLTYLIELTAWSQDAAKAARIANATASLYLADQAAAKGAVASRASEWLNQQAEELRAKVTASEATYEKYRAESGLFASGGEALSDRTLGQLNDQLVQARAKAAEARAKFEQLQQITPDKLQSAAASPDVLQSAVVASLRAQYAEAAKRRAEMATRYGSEHPQAAIAEAQRRDLANQITAEIGRIVASAKTEYEMAASRQRSLEASLDELKTRASDLNQASIRLRELERDAQANRELFQAFLSRAKETAAQVDAQLPDSRIVSSAAVPLGPSYPPRMLIVALGFFGGLGLGVAISFAREIFDGGFRSAEEIETKLGLYPLASIPLVERQAFSSPNTPLLGDMRWPQETARVGGGAPRGESSAPLANLILEQPDSVFAESIRSLKFSLKHAASERGVTTVLVTSALPGEGKSTVAANLARAMAAEDHVLLIDGDLRRPSLAAAFHMQNTAGVADILAGHCDLADSVRKDPHTGLYIIAGKTRLSGSKALSALVSEHMQALLALTRKAFDLVIIDAAPLLPIVDTRMLIEQVDGVVMVVASAQTGRDAVAAAMRESPGLEEKLVGVVLNRAVDDFERYYHRYRDFEPVHESPKA